MNEDELRATFGDFDADQMIELQQWTGGVPLYVSQFLKNTDEDYEREIIESVEKSLNRLQQANSDLPEAWEKILDSVYSCLLGTDTTSASYDKKFFLQKSYKV
jgi:hypothetical protein